MMGQEHIARKYSARCGERVGGLVFQGVAAERGDRGRLLGLFLCDCGAIATYPLSRVLNGKFKSHCGCKTDHGTHRKHGMRDSPEYSSWQAMKSRCLNPNDKDYSRWGGAGVTVSPAWAQSFEEFFAHIGPRPAGTTLDRIDTMRGYEIGNVRWATPRQQQRNRTTAYRWYIKGHEFETHTEAAQHFGVSEHTVWRWVNGQHDNRRNSFTPPREDCYATPRY